MNFEERGAGAGHRTDGERQNKFWSNLSLVMLDWWTNVRKTNLGLELDELVAVFGQQPILETNSHSSEDKIDGVKSIPNSYWCISTKCTILRFNIVVEN